MTWVRLDDVFPRHRKVRRIPPAAGWLHVCALCWCSEHLTDGIIPAGEVRDLSDMTPGQARAAVAELVRRGLWEEIEGGYAVHDYLDYNPSRAKVEKDRGAKSERQQRWRETKRRRGVDACVDASTPHLEPDTRPDLHLGGGVDASTPRLPGEASPSPLPSPSRKNSLSGAEAPPAALENGSRDERDLKNWIESTRTITVSVDAYLATARKNGTYPNLVAAWREARATPPPPASTLPPWCQACGDLVAGESNPAIRNARFRTLGGLPSGTPCPTCHPTAKGATA